MMLFFYIHISCISLSPNEVLSKLLSDVNASVVLPLKFYFFIDPIQYANSIICLCNSASIIDRFYQDIYFNLIEGLSYSIRNS
jgi:hypothetical protein